jgi:hypothetical protein
MSAPSHQLVYVRMFFSFQVTLKSFYCLCSPQCRALALPGIEPLIRSQ